MVKALKLILARQKKRHQRGTGIKFVGIKSLECNFNPKKKTYNPHFHLVVQSEEIANLLKAEWAKLWSRKYVNPVAQKIIKITDKETILIEIIKYGTKIFTEPDVNNKKNAKGKYKIYAAALYNIFSALKGYRIFDRFGFNLPKIEKTEKVSSQFLTDYEEWFYNHKESDWKSSDLDQPLTKFQPPPELVSLLDYNIDTLSE